MSFDARTFRNALGCFPTGVTIVTTTAGDSSPLGVTINSFCSVSLDPPLVLFCLDNKNTCLDAFKAAGCFAINVLCREQRELSIRFASRLEGKWKDVPYETWAGGAPILSGCLANFDCTTVDIRDGGDHQIFIGRVERLRCAQDGEPLVYYRGSYADLRDED